MLDDINIDTLVQDILEGKRFDDAVRSQGVELTDVLRVSLYNHPRVKSALDAGNTIISGKYLKNAELLKSMAFGMFSADLRNAYRDGVPLPPNELPYDLQLMIKRAKFDPTAGVWQYEWLDRGALLDKVSRMVSAYEQAETDQTIHVHLPDERDGKL